MNSDTIDANRTLGRRFFEEQDRLRGGPAGALCAPTYTARIGASPAMDRAGHEQFAVAFYGAFPDMRHHIEDVLATDDRIAVRFVLRGTHSGSFFGMPATHRKVEVPAHVLMRVTDGRVTELLGLFDEAGLMRQLTA